MTIDIEIEINHQHHHQKKKKKPTKSTLWQSMVGRDNKHTRESMKILKKNDNWTMKNNSLCRILYIPAVFKVRLINSGKYGKYDIRCQNWDIM